MRILAGQYKGRTLLPPPNEAITRPITGSVKKSLFAMLGENLSGQTIVDLYCGTGTLGIESLSRGAARCYFAELDGRVIGRLQRNIADVGAAGQSVIWRGDVEKSLEGWLEQVESPVDVAFLDPPYAQARQWDWPRITQAILDPLARKLAEDGVVVLRCETLVEVPADLGALEVGRVRTYGNMMLTMLVRKSAGEAPPQPPVE